MAAGSEERPNSAHRSVRGSKGIKAGETLMALADEMGPPVYPSSLKSEENPDAIARRAKALQLRVAGWTQAQIATVLKVSQQAVSKMLASEIEAVNRERVENVEALKGLCHARHETMINRLWLKAFPNDPKESLDYQAVSAITRILSQDAKIMGYESPSESRIDARVIHAQAMPLVEALFSIIPDDRREDALALIRQVQGVESGGGVRRVENEASESNGQMNGHASGRGWGEGSEDAGGEDE